MHGYVVFKGVIFVPYKIADGKNIDKPTKRSDVVSGTRKMSLVSHGGGGVATILEVELFFTKST